MGFFDKIFQRSHAKGQHVCAVFVLQAIGSTPINVTKLVADKCPEAVKEGTNVRIQFHLVSSKILVKAKQYVIRTCPAYGQEDCYLLEEWIGVDRAIKVQWSIVAVFRTAGCEQILNLLQVTPSVNQNTDYAMKAHSQANRAANQGHHLDAIRGFTEVIASTLVVLPPVAGEAYYNRGNSLDEIGLYPEAVEDFTRALEILEQTGVSIPELLSKIHNNRGISLENLDRRDEAIGDYEVAAKLGNRDASNKLRTLGY